MAGAGASPKLGCRDGIFAGYYAHQRFGVQVQFFKGVRDLTRCHGNCISRLFTLSTVLVLGWWGNVGTSSYSGSITTNDSSAVHTDCYKLVVLISNLMQCKIALLFARSNLLAVTKWISAWKSQLLYPILCQDHDQQIRPLFSLVQQQNKLGRPWPCKRQVACNLFLRSLIHLMCCYPKINDSNLGILHTWYKNNWEKEGKVGTGRVN